MNKPKILRHACVQWTRARSLSPLSYTSNTGVFDMPRIYIHPRRCLVDEVWSLRVNNLKPSHPVTLVSRVVEDNIRFFAYAHYVTNCEGNVDVSDMAAQNGGSYTGIEPMGLIWSQELEPGQSLGTRLTKADVTTPIVTQVYALDGFHDAEDNLRNIEEGNWMAYNECDRLYMDDGVERIPVSEGRLVATLYVPRGPGPFPGVLDIFGLLPRALEHRSALLASRGVASMALCCTSPTQNHEILGDLEFFEDAMNYLLHHPKISNVGVVGSSMGAGFAQLLSALFPNKIKACVSINGAYIPIVKNHTYKGKIFRFIPKPSRNEIQRSRDGLIQMKQFVEKCAKIDGFFENNAIPLERSNCDLLLIHGEEDRGIPSNMADLMAERLEHHGKTGYRILKYPGAGHLIEPPYSPLYSTMHDPQFGGLVDWGGQIRQHAEAQEHSWKEIIHFLKTTLGDASL